MTLKSEWRKQYEATARVFGLNADNYKTEEAFEIALCEVITQKKEEKFAFTKDNARYADRAVELAKEILPSVIDARDMERENLKKHLLDKVRKKEELYQYCLEHKLDVDKIKAIGQSPRIPQAVPHRLCSQGGRTLFCQNRSGTP